MKTTEEILKEELSLNYWKIITKQDEEGHTTFKNWILEAMEAYHAQFKEPVKTDKNIIDKTIRVLTAIIPLAEDATKNITAGSHQEFIQEDKSDIRDAISLLNELKEQPVTDKPSDAAIEKWADSYAYNCSDNIYHKNIIRGAVISALQAMREGEIKEE